MTAAPSPPTLTLGPGKDKLPRNRHPWIFSGALESSSKARLSLWESDPAVATQAARVQTADHRFIGHAWVNPRSKIALRMISWDDQLPREDEWLQTMLRRAFALRRDLGIAEDGITTAGRLVFSEGDGIPGVVVDRFADYLVLQLETYSAEVRRDMIIRGLEGCAGEFMPNLKGILEVSSGDGRAMEGLPPREALVWGSPPPDMVPIREYGVQSWVSLGLSRQKTGFYTDQRENRRRVAAYSRGLNVLDICSFTGAFSTACLSAGAASSTAVDTSQEALDRAVLNARSWEDRFSVVREDAFEFLRNLAPESQDMIILDPPKLVPSRRIKDRGLRAYKDGNLHALAALRPGGYLASFSCSGLVTREDFVAMIQWAAKDVQRDVQILEHLSQAPCHPVRTSFPEGLYLKGVIARVL
ncbi:class I SAM-dependent rRNA methyltransferase [Spirochaeta lutea]|uniref:PUA domain-containing protein n=1 Tax=Spirochaeta lutea TaxID=1480694 RepID=A0A098QSA9_9SPIO|nr:class I SAM-dependent rRNA methyltransferase [Spirochaeta lutea]KGE70770.1 hypothetical protein DC28_14840 [Spirochaeta lutea]